MSAPQLWVLAGGNGAGKSTYYRLFLKPRGLPFINADIIARRLDPDTPEAHSYQAARIAAGLRDWLLRQQSSFCFETVFSHPSKIDLIADAKGLGYEIILVFIHLDTDALNQARVAQRVTEGGHDVPTEKIIQRIPRTVSHIAKALPLVDRARLYDNSSALAPFQPVADINHGQITVYQTPLPDWANSVVSQTLR